VVRTQVLESGDRHWPFAGGEDDSVYDIEVEGNHNFYANGVLVHNCMVRRLAKDVLKELPELSSHVVEVGLSNRKEYDEAERDLIKWLAKTNARKAKRAANAEQLVKWAYLRRCLADGKVRAVADWVRDFLDSGHKLLVFGFHTSLLEALCKEFKKDGAVLVTGKVPAKTRSQLFARFNDDPKCRVLFGNIDAGGTGWSCRATSTVAFCELMWNPAKHRQAMKRVHGLNRGVPGDPARAVFLTARNTIEQPMGAALQKKQAVQDAVLDGKKAAADMDLRDMMERFLMKKGK
jgi:SWI/SNF-related matrix-associated actin-dependent regulator 1 of chromatin subfamily A